MRPALNNNNGTRPAFRIAIGYCLLAGLWIILSDALTSALLTADVQPLAQTIKGCLFVIVTGFFLFLALRGELTRRQQIEDDLRHIQVELEQQVETRTGQLQQANAQLREEISERQKSEQIVQDALEHVNVLYLASQQMVAAPTFEKLLRAFIEPLQRLKGIKVVLFQYSQGSAGKFIAALNLSPDEVANVETDARLADYPLVKGGTDTFEKLIVIEDAGGEIAAQRYQQLFHAHLLVIVPLWSQQKLVGHVDLMWDRSVALGERERQALRLLAPQLATLLENRLLFARIADAEQRYRLIADHVSDVIALIAPNGDCTYVSPSCRTTLGYERDEIVGHSIYEFIHPDDTDVIRGRDGGDRGMLRTFTYRVRHKNGEYRWFETTSTALSSNSQTAELVTVSRDVTIRRTAQLALQQANDELERRVEERTVALMAVNRQLVEQIEAREKRERELESIVNVTTILRNALRIAQSRAELVPIILQQVSSLFDAEGVALLSRDSAVTSGASALRVELASGIYAPWTGETLIEDPVSEQVFASGTAFLNNNLPADFKPFGGLRATACVPLMTQERVIAVLWVGRSSAISREDLRLLIVIADLAATSLQRTGATETLERAVKERTAELNAAYERLKTLDKLKSKFVSDVSHELRTPVTNLAMMIYLLRHDVPEHREQHIEEISVQVARLKGLIESILNLSRLEKAEGQIALYPVNINEVVRQIFSGHIARAQAIGLSLVFEPAEDLPKLMGEPNQIGQVAENLIANAINYTPKGSVRVSTGYDRARQMVTLSVTDTGMGIDEEDIPNLFNRFFRGKRASEAKIPGTGLGLGIVKEIVDLHGGQIEVQSKVDEGTTITVYFPTVQD